MKFDLHCHSTASDGKLGPEVLISRAQAAGVDLFAITDHDTFAGCAPLLSLPQPLQLIAGIELSSLWSGCNIHVVGLDFDLTHPAMQEAVAFQRRVREERAQLISERLAKKGMPNTLQGALAYCPDIGQVGRPHFARYLVEQGYVESMAQAFERWLGAGKIGDVKNGWPALAQAIGWIREAGGVAVLAHPLSYKITFSKLRRLLADFAEAGGQAVEVVGQQADAEQKQALLQIVLQHGLAGSGGSDFHDPDWRWAQIGEIEPLPQNITPVWQLFTRSQVAGAE